MIDSRPHARRSSECATRTGSAPRVHRDSPPQRPPPRPSPRTTRWRTRANQALELVRSKPGITIPQIAEALKIEPNYLYRVMPKLVSDGQIRRDGQGWHRRRRQGPSG